MSEGHRANTSVALCALSVPGTISGIAHGTVVYAFDWYCRCSVNTAEHRPI